MQLSLPESEAHIGRFSAYCCEQVINLCSRFGGCGQRVAYLARESGEPIFITNRGEADSVYMSIEAYEEREKMLAHRASILAAETARLAGAPAVTQEALDAKVGMFLNGKV